MVSFINVNRVFDIAKSGQLPNATNQWRTQFTLIKVQTKNTLILKVVRKDILGFYQSGFIIAF